MWNRVLKLVTLSLFPTTLPLMTSVWRFLSSAVPKWPYLNPCKMSVQESIIFYYKNVNENGHSNNLSFPEFTAKVSQVIPHNITIHKQSLVPNGGPRTDLTFQKSANFLYGKTCKDKVYSHWYLPFLCTKGTQSSLPPRTWGKENYRRPSSAGDY